jgi:methyltransferase
MTVLYAVIAIVVVQRIAELLYAERNTRRLLHNGAVEIAPGQHPWFIALHAAWLVSIAAFVRAATLPNWWLLAAFFALQLARLWVIATLGRYWTTRIITVPGAPLVRRGPYRFIKHPNYTIVVLEIAMLPLAFGAWQIAVVFSLLNALLLAARIRAEDRALAARRLYQV